MVDVKKYSDSGCARRAHIDERERGKEKKTGEECLWFNAINDYKRAEAHHVADENLWFMWLWPECRCVHAACVYVWYLLLFIAIEAGARVRSEDGFSFGEGWMAGKKEMAHGHKNNNSKSVLQLHTHSHVRALTAPENMCANLLFFPQPRDGNFWLFVRAPSHSP